MKIAILVVLILLGIFVFWPRAKRKIASMDFTKMSPAEIVYSWSVFTSIELGIVLMSNWISCTEVVISVADPIPDQHKEKFNSLVEKLKSELPGIVVKIDVTD